MKIILLGDVHGNLPALEAVLEDGRRRGGDIVLNTGDYVGQGPFPDETVSLLSSVESVAVAGNFDRNVLRAKQGKTGEKAELHLWTRGRLSRENRKNLKNLPRTQRSLLAGKRFLLTPGAPEDTVQAAARKITHYGKYGYLGFANGVIQVKGNWDITRSPLVFDFGSGRK